jgi:hypothetical protein
VFIDPNGMKPGDPNGVNSFWVDFKRRQSGFSHGAPQWALGYCDFYDDYMWLLFDIHGTKFKMEGVTLRLWKGDYLLGLSNLPDDARNYLDTQAGGEIGFYNPNRLLTKGLPYGLNTLLPLVESAMTKADLTKIGLVSTEIQVYNKKTNELLASRKEESPSFWTTVFSWDKKGKPQELYTVNTFTFKDEKSATSFYDKLYKAQDKAAMYEHNHNESINIKREKNKVIINWGE